MILESERFLMSHIPYISQEITKDFPRMAYEISMDPMMLCVLCNYLIAGIK